MDSIVVCAVFQDAASHILEWLAFHRMIGVDRFVLYDGGSTDGTAALIARSRFARQVTMIDSPGSAERSVIYSDFFASRAEGAAWAAIIETDDFLHPLAADSLQAALPRYDGFSAVTLRRLLFFVPEQIRPGQFRLATCVNRAPDMSPQNNTDVTLLRVLDIRSVQGSPPVFNLTRGVCDSRGTRVAPEHTHVGNDGVLVVNRYRRFEDGQETVADRRIFRLIPRLRALLHDGVPAAPATPAVRPAPPPAVAPARQARPPLLGIGVITFNRCALLNKTLDLVRQHTRHPRTIVAVADDGSTDGTLHMLRERGTLTVTGRNMSIAWNKNRALFLLAELVGCDVVILMEDDAYPEADNWESDWIQAAQRWGHISGLPRGEPARPVTGSGTLDDPFESEWLTAQCAVFSRESILFGGYFDTRFRGYGHEHVEHTVRLRRLGYSPTSEAPGMFKSIWGGIGVRPVPSLFNAKDELAQLNRVVAAGLMDDLSYRGPWRTEEEARQFRDEMRQAVPQAVR